MILFHVEALDFDEPDVRLRAWLPACFLRRSGVSAKLVDGELPVDLLSRASCVILAGRNSGHALSVARKARHAGVPVILDIGNVDILAASMADLDQRARFAELAAHAISITAGNATLARRIEQLIGAEIVMVAPDPIELDVGFAEGIRHHPGATVRLLAKWIAGRTRDAFAGVRREWRGRGRARVDADHRRIVWFGASYRPSGEGGVAELLLAASDLADLAEEVPLRLDIVGRSRRSARRLLKNLAIPMVFHSYSPLRVRQRLRKADLCLLPGGGDPDSLAMSSARADLAFALEVPAVTPTTARPWLLAMRAALADRTAAITQQDRIRHSVTQEHDARAVTNAWQQAIDVTQAAAGKQRPARRIAIRADQRLRVLLLLQQVQDLDLIVPIAEAASACADLDVRVAILAKIAVPASRRLRTVCSNGGKVEFWHGPDLLNGRIAPASFAVDVAVTASEGPGYGARFARAFVEAGSAAGARTATLQHGVDNGGLTYGPMVSPATFQADLILTWGGANRLTKAARAEIRAKVVPVGCPKRVFSRGDFPGFPYADRPFIAVFENLHWRRYGEDYRTRFVNDLVASAAASPDLTFVLKPHMGGQWFTRRGHAAKPLPVNLEIANPAALRWRRFTADAFLAHASAVITTPSTIALDAARYGVPAALVTYGISAANYAPLPRLEQAGDWFDFVDQIRRGHYERKKLEDFYADAAIPGDAIARILTVIRMAGVKRSHAEILSALHAPPPGLAVS